MPQRHSRNSNDLAHFTYEERRKLGFGTQKERLGKDSIKPFDSCSLCLVTAIDPLCCRSGHLFCKECIYSCLLTQKKSIKRKRAAWEAAQQQEVDKRGEELAANRAQEIEEFDRQNNRAVPTPHTAAKRRAIPANDDDDDFVTPSVPAAGNGNEDEGGNKGDGDAQGKGNFQGANSVKTTAFEEEAVRTMRAYWLPSQTPAAKVTIDPPPSDTLCPEGAEKLRLKDLFPVTFTEVPSDDTSAGRSKKAGATSALVAGGKGRFMCPACTDTLTNASKVAAVVPCGHVLCVECVGKFVRKDKACTVCSVACGGAKDVVELEHGGTGYAGHGDALVAKAYKHLGSGPTQTSGRRATRIG